MIRADQFTPATPIALLRPFVASYQVYDHGRSLGTATMQVAALDNGRWRVDLTMKGGGLLRIAGLNFEQSTVFDVVDGRYRPLGQSTVRRVLLGKRRTAGSYDWSRRVAQWTGDVKESRRAPVPLLDGDMSGLLINLAIIRDAMTGNLPDVYHSGDHLLPALVRTLEPKGQIVDLMPIIDKEGGTIAYPLKSKQEVAVDIVNKLATLLK